jgi:Protein of unknown function (DUF3231)
MQTGHNVRLTSAELSQLWLSYINDSMSICVLKYFLEKVEDTDIRPVVQYTLQLSQDHIKKVTGIFTEEKHPLPHGFTNEDVDINAPRLYSDDYILRYIYKMSTLGLSGYSVGSTLAVRSDIHKYFRECIIEYTELLKRALDVLLSKGLYIRSPYIPIPEKVDFVTKQSFLTGWFGERRPLTSIEISYLYENIKRNAFGGATLIGFSQVAQNEKVKQYFVRGKEIANKHIEVLSSVLRENDLSAPMTWDSEVTNSTTQLFSDKLMMYVTTSLITIGTGYYGASLGASTRRDLGVHYGRFITEISQYAEDGANIMIENGWLEQPPSASNRDELVNKK